MSSDTGPATETIATMREARRNTEQAQLYKKKPERESDFINAEFACQLSDYRFRRDGSILIQLVVPHRYRQQALDLSDAYGVMLLVSAERYKNKNVTDRIS